MSGCATARSQVVMTTAGVTVRAPVGTLAAVAVVVAVSVGPAAVLSDPDQRAWDNAAQVTSGAVAAVICFGAARGVTGAARRWRSLTGVGLSGWSLGQLVLCVQDTIEPGRAPDLALADAGLVILPACVMLSLLIIAGGLHRPTSMSPPRDRIELVLDSVLVSGSLLALTWSTLLGGVTAVVVADQWEFAAVLSYPIADLMLVTMVALLLTTRPASRPMRRPLLLIGAGLVAFAVSDGLRVAAMALGGPALSSPANAGFVLGPVLLALAAMSPPADAHRLAVERVDADWLHLLLPYVPVIATGVMIAVRTGTGGRLTPFEAYLGWGGLGLVVARQMFTIVDNTVLLARVSEGRRRLHHQAYHDPLTGLANRALFRERLLLALEGHRHRAQPLALLFADLDDFKGVNDSFGHAVGDRLLRAVAERLLSSVRREDVVSRLGGDEFAVLIERQPGDAEPVGRRIMAALREPFIIDGQVMHVSASVGLVVPEGTDAALSADALLRRADAAMYAGKRRGKNALVRYAAGAEGAVNADLPRLLAAALSGDPRIAGFEVHYQPIVRLRDGAPVAVEALARWTDPVIGVVDPDAFVTVAERTGLVAALDDFVLDRTCADANALTTAYGRPVDLHVNVSAVRLGGDGLIEAIDTALHRHQLSPDRLVVEITETRRIPDLPGAAAAVELLRDRGVRVALDDFGSGFNALAQLHALPVDIVKLDATLTDVDTAPERAGALCRSMLTICAELGIEVVAEGVETADRAAALAELGCPLAQGYLFGQPAPVHQLVAARLPVGPGAIPRQPTASTRQASTPTDAHLAS